MIEVWKNFNDMQIKLSVKIHSAWALIPPTGVGGGEELYSHNAGMELFSTKLRHTAVCQKISSWI